jgi:hypothetical protein
MTSARASKTAVLKRDIKFLRRLIAIRAVRGIYLSLAHGTGQSATIRHINRAKAGQAGKA